MADSTGSVTGTAGPMDVVTIVTELMKPQRKNALEPLTSREQGINATISGLGSIKSALATYQQALKGLTSTSFGAQKATVANAGSGSTLTADALSAEVNNDDQTRSLAQKIQSENFPAGQIFRRGDTLSVRVGREAPTFITLQADTTLEGVKSTINMNKKTGVVASIETNSQGQRLVLESTLGGAANVIKINANNSLSKLAYDGARNAPGTMTQIQAPRDAARATPGTYAIEVSQLAKPQKLVSAAVNASTSFDEGILAIKVGQNDTALIKADGSGLTGIRNAINASSAGVIANVITDGDKQYLSIVAKESGAANSVRITGTGKFAAFAFDPSGTLSTPPVASDQTYGNGTLALQVGENNIALNIVDQDGDGSIGLGDVARAIDAANAGVSARVVSDNGSQRLVITPQGSQTVSLSGSGSYAGLNGTIMGQVNKPQDALLTIDGVAVKSASNQVKNVIWGVQLNLAKVTTTNDKISLTVNNDNSGATAAATTFTSAFNTLNKVIRDLTRQTRDNKTPLNSKIPTLPLASDNAIKGILGKMRDIVNTPVQTSAGVTSLAQNGITYEKTGELKLDATKYANAVSKNFEGVTQLFTSSSGLMPRLQKEIDDMLGDKGLMANKTDGMQLTLKQLGAKKTAVEKRLEQIESREMLKYNRLNQRLAQQQSAQMQTGTLLDQIKQAYAKRGK